MLSCGMFGSTQGLIGACARACVRVFVCLCLHLQTDRGHGTARGHVRHAARGRRDRVRGDSRVGFVSRVDLRLWSLHNAPGNEGGERLRLKFIERQPTLIISGPVGLSEAGKSALNGSDPAQMSWMPTWRKAGTLGLDSAGNKHFSHA